MTGKRRFKKPPRNRAADFYLWSIRNQDAIAGQVRIHMWSAVASFLLATLLLPIPLEKALTGLFVLGLAVAAVLWVLVERRRSWLLRIDDPELRETAHRTMVAYLRNKIGEEHPDHPGSCGGNSCRHC